MDTVDYYEELLKLDPGLEAFASVAEELCAQGLWVEAVRVCRQGLAFHPHHLRGRVLLGWALKELGEADEAQKVLREAAGEVQKNALLFKLLAEITEKAGDCDGAESFMNMFRNLHSGAFEQPLEGESEAVAGPDVTVKTEPLAGPEVTDTMPPTARFLTSLLASFEAKPAGPPRMQMIFTDEDRQRLTQLFQSRKH
jgi:tetratricopeptide (TPR) repeat protein